MSELPADGSVPQCPAGAANGDSDVPQAEVGGERREPAEPREGPADEAGEGPTAGPYGEENPESRPRRENRGEPAAWPRPQREPEGFGPDLGQAQPLFGEDVPRAYCNRLRGFDEANWVFMDVRRAREVAHHASWQTRYPNVYVDYLRFIEDLFASVAISRLAAALGCDSLKDEE
ncbi:EP300-interacting inhibitor of differentiation 2-like [Cynocephalus volans]|uniref:EP300-interacting inhibitor of differentiation 2-like n=1 Tax=Cynocephalus volans TaxID=110931 RepID=UPI002FCC1132